MKARPARTNDQHVKMVHKTESLCTSPKQTKSNKHHKHQHHRVTVNRQRTHSLLRVTLVTSATLLTKYLHTQANPSLQGHPPPGAGHTQVTNTLMHQVISCLKN
ncbi:hypothetical protein E2C01_035404 [Portunus trituberculatus]|uniref:Uncharacterized protein n=1 Tax=Portunus trituberculatus TaxID=210409 RepID=A0A5B7F985_PORTR|nr:hypothetical protein [Portunus trituberculatus]